MSSSLLFQVTKKEKIIRNLWCALILIDSCFLMYNFSFISVKYLLTCLGGFLLIYFCSYKNHGLWLLRFFLVTGLIHLYLTLRILWPNIISQIFSSYDAKQGKILHAVTIAIWLFTVIEIIVRPYLTFKMIFINKKLLCQKYLDESSSVQLQDFQKCTDQSKKNQLFVTLSNQYPKLSWLFSRIYKGKDQLLTKW